MKAGLTQAEMDKMSLSELQKAVDKAKNKTEIEKTIADIKVLNPNATGSNGTALSDMTLVSSRRCSLPSSRSAPPWRLPPRPPV